MQSTATQMKAYNLLAILDRSIERNGPDKPLTLSHLRNLIQMAANKEEAGTEEYERFQRELEDECTDLNG